MAKKKVTIIPTDTAKPAEVPAAPAPPQMVAIQLSKKEVVDIVSLLLRFLLDWSDEIQPTLSFPVDRLKKVVQTPPKV